MVVFVHGVPMRGLCPTLMRTFYPFYSYKKCTKNRVRISGNKRKREATEWGKKTDASLDRIISGEEGLINYEALMIKEHIEERGMRMVETQTKVWNIDARVGTELDLVCKDSDGKYVIYEIKSGFRGYYKATSGHTMCLPFNNMDDSVASHHQLQLAFGTDMFEKCYEDREVNHSECAVLVVNDILEHHSLIEISEEKKRQAWFSMSLSKGESVKDREKYVKRQRRIKFRRR